MLISYNWLKEYVDTKLAPEKLAELLTMAGLSVESVRKAGSDHTLEIEVTSNRPDWLSYTGVAREVAALTGTKLKIHKAGKIRAVPQVTKVGAVPILKVRVENKDMCPRYTARIIRNVTVKESPEWLKAKLETMGLRPVNNIVDITNFCLFETGEPMHAFDLDKLRGPDIVVRKASKGEKIATIDGEERTLDDSSLVIADKKKPVAIAGVMGGCKTEVTASTKNILLEAAYFDPISIRRTARRLDMSTESSYRFERKVDMENIPCASDRATALICDLTGGSAAEFIDIGRTRQKKNMTVELRYQRMRDLLAIDIPKNRADKILSSLGLKLRSGSKEKSMFYTPRFRHDLHNEIDLIEEIARIHGYDKIPETIPPVASSGAAREPFEMIVEKRVRGLLVGMGCNEIITYSLFGRKYPNMLNTPDEPVVEIINPMTSEQDIMRPGLLPGLFSSLAWNINRKTNDLRLFEIGKIYRRDSGDTFSEMRRLSIGIMGQLSSDWTSPCRECNLFDLKGVVEILLGKLGIADFSITGSKDARFSAAACGRIEIKGEPAGVLGEVDRGALGNFDIKNKVYAAEIDLDVVIRNTVLERQFKDLPRYPYVYRDISIIAAKETSNVDILSVIKEACGAILQGARLIDRYTGGQIPEGKVSLTYRLEYGDPAKTLSDREISATHSAILKALETKLGARLR